MRYLRRYNERKESTYLIDDLKEFCEENLSYLLDSDFSFEVMEFGSRNSIILRSNNKDGLYLDDIKSDFISFLELLNMKYTIMHEIEFDTVGDVLGHLYLDKESIIEDDVDDKFANLKILKVKINLDK
jgi:hypothetical protein